MANTLPTEKKIAVIGALAEGNSIRSIERMTGIHRDTVMRLGVKVGQGCLALMDSKMRNLSCKNVQVDEIWGFVGKKQGHLTLKDDPSKSGDVWTWCAIDAETKLVPCFKVGKRTGEDANAFIRDLADRCKNRIQLSADGLSSYVEAVELAFGGQVDFGQVVKSYAPGESSTPERRYSPSEVTSIRKTKVVGKPNWDLISTSYIERVNLTTRTHMKRLARLTLAFSKKWENFEAAAGLNFAYYNFVKRHNKIRCTPAMAAGVTRSLWTVAELVEAAS